MKNVVYLFLLLILFGIYSCSSENEDFSKEAEVNIETRQMKLNGWIPPSSCDASKLKIFIEDECIGTPWQTAVNSAAAAYNNSNTSIGFSIVDNEEIADIVIKCVNNIPTDGLAETPTEDYKVGAGIKLNTATIGNCSPALEPCLLTHIVMHELGHSLGLVHNELNVGDVVDGYGVEHIDGTAAEGTTDPGSIFNETVTCETSCTFNANDLLALRTLYPDNCDCFAPKILGPGNLCPDEVGSYCISSGTNVIVQNINWFGHPDIENSGLICESVSYSEEGPRFIYADVQIGSCSYFLSKKIEVGPPDVIDNLEVSFDPCLSIIKITGLALNTTYNWGDFTGFRNVIDPVFTGPYNNIVNIHVPYDGGETLCFTVNTTGECGSSTIPCEVCYTAPDCPADEQPIIVNPSNTCNFGGCPAGFICNEGLCCPNDEIIIEEPPCESPCDGDCGAGYDCIDGCCVAVGGNPCKFSWKCPPGFFCIDGICSQD